MGEVADMMINGVLCEGCGVYLEHGEPGGFPRYCELCQEMKEEEKDENENDERKERG